MAKNARRLPSIATPEHTFLECRGIGKAPDCAGLAITIIKISVVNRSAPGMPVRPDEIVVAFLHDGVGVSASDTR
jgi:hypothetical protein